MIGPARLLSLCILPAVLYAEFVFDPPAYTALASDANVSLVTTITESSTTYSFSLGCSRVGYSDEAFTTLSNSALVLNSGDFATAAWIRGGHIISAPNSDPSSEAILASTNGTALAGDMVVILLPHNTKDFQSRRDLCLRSLATVRGNIPNNTAGEVLQVALSLNPSWCAGFSMTAATIKEVPGGPLCKFGSVTTETLQLLRTIEAEMHSSLQTSDEVAMQF